MYGHSRQPDSLVRQPSQTAIQLKSKQKTQPKRQLKGTYQAAYMKTVFILYTNTKYKKTGVVTTTKWPMTNYILFFLPVVKCV